MKDVDSGGVDLTTVNAVARTPLSMPTSKCSNSNRTHLESLSVGDAIAEKIRDGITWGRRCVNLKLRSHRVVIMNPKRWKLRERLR